MIGGGLDRKDLQPYNPDAHDESTDPNKSMGCHVGLFAGLNVDNAQPGWVYAWADSSPRGIRMARLQRYIVVQEGDPERAAYKNDPNHSYSDLDSANTAYPGVVLVKRSAELVGLCRF